MAIKNNFALIKPASSLCNLDCKYCFYKDVASNREVYSHKLMTYETLDNIIESYTNEATDSTTFLFQGGEPLLCGVDFFKHYNQKCQEVLARKRKENPNFQIFSSIQTSAFKLNEEFAQIFKEGDFLVGVSLDGPREYHDLNRLHGQNGTFDRVMQSIKILKEYEISFNALCVVTNKTYDKAKELIDFFVSQDILNLQFIPAIAPFDKKEIYIDDAQYAKFYVDSLETWYEYFTHGTVISIRHIEDLFTNIMYGSCQSCDMQGHCSNQNVIESDGSIYPCDFYVIDKYKLGTVQNGIVNLNEDVLNSFLSYEAKRDGCSTCNFYRVCKGGCQRNRGQDDRSFLCKSFKSLNQKHLAMIEDVVRKIR